MNLYDETIEVLKEYGKTIEDVLYVQGADFRIPFNNFISLAKETNYYNGFGAPEIATDLVLVGDDFWLERDEYDGSEWWEFRELPSKIERVEIVDSLAIKGYQIGWEHLSTILNYDEEEF